MSTPTQAEIPAHVPPELVRPIDVFNIQSINEDVHLGWKQVQEENPPIFFTPYNGGHWIMTKAPLIERLFQEPEVFASRYAQIPPRAEGMPEAILIASDGEDHRAYRSLILPFLVAKRLSGAIERARALAIELVEGLKDKGECDFVGEFAQHLPIQIFLDMVDLPLSDRPKLLGIAQLVRMGEGEERDRVQGEFYAYLNEWIDKRIANPGDDMISAIVQGKVGDRPLTRQEMIGVCLVVLLGGLDTVASMLGFIANFLARNDEIRQRLVDQPALIPDVIDELLRRFGVAAPSRRVAHDVEVDGVALKAGDIIYVGSFFHGLDDDRWKDALTVDLDRRVENPMTFGGNGPHRCPGSPLARSEVRIFLEEWLKRIPHFRVKQGTKPLMGSGSVNGVTALELQWDV